MTRVSLTKLVALQQHRIDEIQTIGDRMRERAANTLSKTIVQTRICTINDRWSDIRRIHDDITLRNDSDGHPYISENRYAAMQQTYEDTLDWLLTTLANTPGDSEGNERRRDRDEDAETERAAKLPRLDLPNFSGKYEDWDSFADIFTTLVHDVPRIADTTKLQYLKSCLSGSAAELVKNVPILGINYAVTWKALKDRYHNPRLTINSLLDSFLDITHIKRESAAELRSFVDNAQRIVRALTSLKAPVEHWDMWLVHILEVRLAPESRKQWETELSVRDHQIISTAEDGADNHLARMPKFSDLANFLERRAHSLTAIQADKEGKGTSQPIKAKGDSRRIHHVQAAPPAKAAKCALCSKSHFISQCPTFRSKRVYDRQTDARHLRLCFNCLGSHKYQNCQSKGRCRSCNEKHHSLLHFSKRPNNQAHAGTTSSGGTSTNNKAEPTARTQSHLSQLVVDPGLAAHTCNARAATRRYPILLATAQVIVVGPNGKQTRARVLLDQGSEATFVSDALVQLLGLEREHVQTSLTGVGGCKAGTINWKTSFTLCSQTDVDFQLEVDAFVLPRLTGSLPARNLLHFDIGPFKDLLLADPEFYISDRVDIMLGADHYGQLLRPGIKTFASNCLVGQNTALGWIVSGPTHDSSARRAVDSHSSPVTALRCSIEEDLNATIEKFWTIEEVPTVARALNPEEAACEKFYEETYMRDNNGRFIVHLPFKSALPDAAVDTRRIALGSLKQQAMRLVRDANLARSYTEFMEAYIELGHMVPVPPPEIDNPCSWYLPHHAVVTHNATHSKTRVVFDASRRTRDSICLNDFLMTGPALQSDLALILLNWRRYRYVFTADIVKMFRQIRLASNDQDFHRILWPPAAPIDWRLTTVTMELPAPHISRFGPFCNWPKKNGSDSLLGQSVSKTTLTSMIRSRAPMNLKSRCKNVMN